MSTSTNEIWINTGKNSERLHLDDETQLLPSFQANARDSPSTIQADYSPEFSVPGTAHNHRLLKHAAASQPAQGSAYVRVPCVLTSGGVETLPLALLYLKGYKAGRYQLQIAGGNRRLIEALGDKKLSDLDLNRFNHAWTPANVLAGLAVSQWQQQGWGYEVYDRGRPIDLQALDPYSLYPSVSGRLLLYQLLADAGFTADSLAAEPLFAALNVPAANPYEFSQAFRDSRFLQAGFFYLRNTNEQISFEDLHRVGIGHLAQFAAERLNFSYTSRKPYHAPDPAATSATYFAGRYTADTLGYYDLAGSITLRFGSETPFPGSVRCFVELRVNGKSIFDAATGFQLGKEEMETDPYVTHTFAPKLDRYLLRVGDYVELWWRGDEIDSNLGISPTRPFWQIGPYGSQTDIGGGLSLANEVKMTASLLPEFPKGGLVRLQDWLPDITQLEFLKSIMLMLGLTIETDSYEPHLNLSPGNQLLQNVGKAKNWTAKRDAFTQSNRPPERELSYRLGSYGQLNTLVWAEDENVKKGYGDGSISVEDEILSPTYEIAKLPFAATQPSPTASSLLQILNFEAQDLAANPPTYSKVEAKPRLTLKRFDGEVSGKLIMVPATDSEPAKLADFTTTLSYFAGAGLSLMLNSTVLTTYWQDVKSFLDQARVLTERYRLTASDIASLRFNTPIWDSFLGDYFAVSRISEYSPSRPTEVHLVRINASYLPPPATPNQGGGLEFFGGEFGGAGEWY